jgi:hypothetical protein
MSLYTVSWCVKEGGEWVKRVERVEYPDDDAARKHVFPHEAIDSPYVQIESSPIATPYIPKSHKTKNTNAWKPKRYGA